MLKDLQDISLREEKQCVYFILCKEKGDKNIYLSVYASRKSGRVKTGIIHWKCIYADMCRSGIDNV